MKPLPDPLDAGFSVVIPFFNEAENIGFVLEEVRRTLPNAEIVAVDDGSTDGTWEEIVRMRGVRGIRLARNMGQSAAMFFGLKASNGAVCGLMDGDGQNDPANFIPLLKEFYSGSADVVCGYRANRSDTWDRKAASKVANSIRRAFLDDGVRDTGCSQKVFAREAIDLLVPFRTMHRYLPALFKHGGLRLSEVPVLHRARRAGASKYNNLGRALVGIYDLVGVAWLLRRRLLPVQIEQKEPG